MSAGAPDLPETATHATCTDATYASWHHKPATWDWGSAGRAGFHRWAVRKETTTGPGGRWEYANDGYYSLGLIVQTVSGVPYEL